MAEELFGAPLVQPDQRSCGAAVLVVARMLTDPGYAESASAPDRFRAEVLDLHRRVTSGADTRGRMQLPWPRALGTPPWAVDRELTAITGTDHRSRLVRWSGASVFDDLAEVTSEESPAALYVGSGWLPRHVVLAFGDGSRGLRCYEPARGVVVEVPRARFVDGRLELAGWDRPWFTVAPTARRTPA